MSASTPGERSAYARAAALAMHSQGKTNTGPARAAFFARFEHQVDPDGLLTPEERRRRADQAMPVVLLLPGRQVRPKPP